MPVSASDLVLVGAANHAEDDSSAQGGAIAKGKLLFFSNADIAATDEVEVVASDAITAEITIYGRSAVGASISEAVSFSAEAGPKVTALAFERVEKVVVTSGSIGASVVVTVRRESTDVEILKLYGSSASPSGTAITEVRKMFLGASIPASGSNTYYEKAFLLNAHGSDTLSDPTVREQADPEGVFTFGIEATPNGSVSVANRLTAPTGITFDNADKAFSPATLAAGDAIPVWVKLVLAAGETPGKSYFTLRLEGQV